MDEITPFWRLEQFARAIFSVPKSAILAAEEEHRRTSPRVKAAAKVKSAKRRTKKKN